jgi:hypothetical protein
VPQPCQFVEWRGTIKNRKIPVDAGLDRVNFLIPLKRGLL